MQQTLFRWFFDTRNPLLCCFSYERLFFLLFAIQETLLLYCFSYEKSFFVVFCTRDPLLCCFSYERPFLLLFFYTRDPLLYFGRCSIVVNIYFEHSCQVRFSSYLAGIYLFRSTMETLDQCVRYVQCQQQRHQNDIIDVVFVSCC